MNEKLIISVSFNEESGQYQVKAGEGSSVPEVAFAMAVVTRCFAKEKLIENPDRFLELVKKYATDSQFEELKNESDN